MNSPKKRAKNAIIVYELPKPTRQYADSVIVRKWHAFRWEWNLEGKQWTEYQGLRSDLIAVGIAPEQIFLDVGKCGKKTARIQCPNGKIERIEVKRLKNDKWNVERRHVYGKPPYVSPKAVCTEANGSLDDRIAIEKANEEKKKKPPQYNPEGFKNHLCREVEIIFDVLLLPETAGAYEQSSYGMAIHRLSEQDRQ